MLFRLHSIRTLMLFWVCLFLMWQSRPGLIASENLESYQKLQEKILKNVDHLQDSQFLFAIGLDSSGSMNTGNQFNEAKKLIAQFLSEIPVPGDQVYLFHFGPKPYSILETPQLLSNDLKQAWTEIGKLQHVVNDQAFNEERGTDLHWAKARVLELAKRKKIPNLLYLIVTDSNEDEGKWIRNPKNRQFLQSEIRDVHVRMEFVAPPSLWVHSGFRVKRVGNLDAGNLTDSGSPSPEKNIRKMIHDKIKPTETPTPSPTPTGERTEQAPTQGGQFPAFLIFVVLLLGGAVGLIFMARPIPVCASMDTPQMSEYYALRPGESLSIGRNEDAVDSKTRVFDPGNLSTVAVLTHKYPQKLVLKPALEGDSDLEIKVDGITSDGISNVRTGAEIHYRDVNTGQPFQISLARGVKEVPGPISKEGDENYA